MKRIFAAAATLALSACATVPGGQQASAIQSACAVDAGLRPVVTILLATPGAIQPEDAAIVVAARAVIDPICANPSAPLEANALVALTTATAQIAAITAKAPK